MAKFESIPELIESYKSRFIPQKAKGVDTVVQFKLAGDPDASFFVQIKDQQCRIAEGQHEKPALTIKATVQDWLKLNNGDANPMMMMMQGKLKVDGPLDVATRFQTMFGA